MSAAHTPGPWVIDAPYLSEVQTADRLTIASCWYADADGAQITVTGVLPCSPQESAANARLIAAAPDMLEALRWAENTIIAMRPSFAQVKDEGHAYHDQVLDTVRAAIAKATTAVEPNSVGTPQGVNQND